jgi:hypothetical protein
VLRQLREEFVTVFAPHINAIATAVPPHVLHQEKVADRAGHVFTGREFERLRPVYANAEIETRHSCVPIEWYETGHGFAERNRLYVDNALALLEHAARNVLDRVGLDPREVDGIVVASTTGIATPSLDAMLVDRLGLRRSAGAAEPEDRQPFGIECFASPHCRACQGASGLALAVLGGRALRSDLPLGGPIEEQRHRHRRSAAAPASCTLVAGTAQDPVLRRLARGRRRPRGRGARAAARAGARSRRRLSRSNLAPARPAL